MLLRTDGEGWDAWRISTFGGKVVLIQKIWELTKETLTIEELKNEMLLRTDGGARNALQLSASMGRLDVMQILWELAKVILTTVEIKKEILSPLTNEDIMYVGQMQHRRAH